LFNSSQPRLSKTKQKVDRTNFLEGLAALRQALAVGDFYALDCEFTGIDSSSNGSSGRARGRNLPAFRPPSCDAAPPPTPIDDPEERWPALRSQASRFAVAQVGIAVFEWVKGSEGGRGGGYRAHPFNCWTFVSSSSGSSATNPDAAAAFQCTPGSLAFLSSAGFDFNRWIGKGIPSCSARERDELLAREEARKGAGAGGGGGGGGAGGTIAGGGGETKERQEQPPPPRAPFQRPPIVPSSPHDVALVEETVSRVSEWLRAGEGGGGGGGEPAPASLRLRAGNAFARALVYQTLERGPGLAALRFHPGTEATGEEGDARFVARTLWPDEEEALLAEAANSAAAAAAAGGEAVRQQKEPPLPSAAAPAAALSLPPQQQQRPRRADIVLLRVAPGGARLAAERESQRRLERARLGSGFALFLEALRDSGLPCAVHNGASDLAHVVASFGDGLPLPASLAGFAEGVERWFPGGVFDTKVLASGAFLRGGPFGSATALRDLYEGLVSGRRGGGGGGWGAEATGAGAPAGATPPSPLALLPRVPRPSLPASGAFSRYGAALRSGGSSIDGLEHEAGFDALLTGAALWGLANALTVGSGGEQGGDDDDDDDESDDGRIGNGSGGNNTRRLFPTSLPPPLLLQKRVSQQQQQQRDPSPRDLVASIEAAAAASQGGGGRDGDGDDDDDDAPWLSLNPPRRVRASRLPRAALGCVYAHMSDWGVLPLMEGSKKKKKATGEAAAIRPPERGNVLFVVPLPIFGSEGEDGDVFRALHSLASRDAGAGRCRVTPRLRGWAASLELFEAGCEREGPPRPRPPRPANGEEAAPPPAPRRAVDPEAVARALASLPQLRGCRVLDYRAFRDWKQRALSRFGPGSGPLAVDEERAAAEAAADERAALAAALEKDAAAAAAAAAARSGAGGVFGRRRAASAAADGVGGDAAAPPRKRSRGGEGGEGGGGERGGKACVLM
jgi:hypothetical protein